MNRKINTALPHWAMTGATGAAHAKNNKKPKMLKEKIIMIASSAFVMTALTVTGLYMKDKDAEKHDKGYSIDYSRKRQWKGYTHKGLRRISSQISTCLKE